MVNWKGRVGSPLNGRGQTSHVFVAVPSLALCAGRGHQVLDAYLHLKWYIPGNPEPASNSCSKHLIFFGNKSFANIIPNRWTTLLKRRQVTVLKARCSDRWFYNPEIPPVSILNLCPKRWCNTHICRHMCTDPTLFTRRATKRKERNCSLFFQVTHNLLKLDFGSIPILINSSKKTPCLKNTQYVIRTISLVILTFN